MAQRDGQIAPAPALVWFRHDLRLRDNPALTAAAASGRPVAALFVLDDETPGPWRYGGAQRWWLHHSLAALSEALAERGVTLILRRGLAETVVPALAAEIGAGLVAWNRLYEPFAVARDSRLKAALKAAGVEAQSFAADVIREPWELTTGSGGFFKVFSPFWRAWAARGAPRAPLPAPLRIDGFDGSIASDRLDDWGLLPTKPDWAGGLRATWRPGEAEAHGRLRSFLDQRLRGYADQRNRPDVESTSALSPHLRWGEISPLEAFHGAGLEAERDASLAKDVEKFQAELGWREFARHLLFHQPDLPDRAFRPAFERFPYRSDPDAQQAWSRGRTGYPIVDAGMRQLWETGWMHNRVRMIAASFLTKHLLIDWRVGEAWFWDTLVDADLATNAASWQWVAGSGADAAPYFRIFNPVSQGESFDPVGRYVRTWVPELAPEPANQTHKPSDKPRRGYPAAIVDHGAARARALAAFETIKNAA